MKFGSKPPEMATTQRSCAPRGEPPCGLGMVSGNADPLPEMRTGPMGGGFGVVSFQLSPSASS